MSVCYRTMANDWAAAEFDRRHEDEPYHDGTFTRWGSERSAETPYKYDSGVNVWVAETDLGVGANIWG